MTAYAFNLVKINNGAVIGVRAPNLDFREVPSPIGTDGTIHQTSSGIIRAAPIVQFSTIAVRSLFTTLGTGDAVPFVAMDGTNGVQCIGLQINTAGPGYLGTSSHHSMQAPRGMMFLDRVSWSPGQVAEAAVTVYTTTSSGSTSPVTESTVALPTLSANTEQLVLSSLSVNGTTLTRVTSYEVVVNHRAENNDESVCFSTGLPYPLLVTQAGVAGQTEVICTIDTLDIATSITATGTVTATFTQINHLGVGLDTETATVTINSSLIEQRPVSGVAGGPAGRRLTIRGTYDGNNAPITIATA